MSSCPAKDPKPEVLEGPRVPSPVPGAFCAFTCYQAERMLSILSPLLAKYAVDSHLSQLVYMGHTICNRHFNALHFSTTHWIPWILNHGLPTMRLRPFLDISSRCLYRAHQKSIITLDKCCFKACDAMTHVLQGDLVALQGTLCFLPGNTLQLGDPIGQNQHGSTLSFKRTNTSF